VTSLPAHRNPQRRIEALANEIDGVITQVQIDRHMRLAADELR